MHPCRPVRFFPGAWTRAELRREFNARVRPGGERTGTPDGSQHAPRQASSPEQFAPAPPSYADFSDSHAAVRLRTLAGRDYLRLLLLRLFDFFFVTVVAFGHNEFVVWICSSGCVICAALCAKRSGCRRRMEGQLEKLTVQARGIPKRLQQLKIMGDKSPKATNKQAAQKQAKAAAATKSKNVPAAAGQIVKPKR